MEPKPVATVNLVFKAGDYSHNNIVPKVTSWVVIEQQDKLPNGTPAPHVDMGAVDTEMYFKAKGYTPAVNLLEQYGNLNRLGPIKTPQEQQEAINAIMDGISALPFDQRLTQAESKQFQAELKPQKGGNS